MINFRNVNITLAIVSILFIILSILFRISTFYYIVWIVVMASFYIWGSISLCNNFYVNAQCYGNTRDKIISLTFDDGPDKRTSKVLDILKQSGIKATFFIIGSKAIENKELIQRIVNEGHILGSHSMNHSFWFDFYRRKKMLAEIEDTNKIITEITGKKPALFRPPYGITNPTISYCMKKTRQHVIGWSIRSFDTSIKSPQKVITRVTNKIAPGSIILLHDTHKNIIEILKSIILFVNENEYKFAGIDQLLNIEPYE